MMECLSLNEFDASNWEEIEAAFAKSKALKMKQFWLPQQEADFASTEVRLGWRFDSLYVFATMEDVDIFSESTEDAQPMWRLGDVFEIFLRALPDAPWYEFHVTPNNHHLELCWPDDPQVCPEMEQRGYETFITPNSIITSTVRIDKEKQCWQVLAEIPAQLISDGKSINTGQEWLVSFCRYDAFQDGRPSVLASTSDFTKVIFSRQQEWSRMIFVEYKYF